MRSPFIFSYLSWHYHYGFRDVFRVWTNYAWFVVNFFSLGVLARTLFSPFMRIQPQTSGKNMSARLERFAVNTVMRIAGMFVRLFFIMFGVGVLLVVSLIGIFFQVTWVVLPFAPLFLVIQGIIFL